MTNVISQDPSYSGAIALVGMSGRFPDAHDIATFWRNILAGVKSIHSFSDDELLAAGVDPAVLQDPNYVKAGTLLPDADMFDASFFGYTPREAEIIDPQHRLFLECAWEALEQAACVPSTYTGLVGVFAGSAHSLYHSNNISAHPDIMDTVGKLMLSVSNDKDSLASTISYKMNLRGPSIAVQTFCSTSLVAVHLACQSLLNYECDIALAGGAALKNPQESGYWYEEGGIVSPDGECRTFDANAQGSVMGSGVGAVTLKRLDDALQDRNSIYAIIRGSALNNDGGTRVSYTAPGLNGQTAVIAEAIGNAGVDVETIQYVEAHGTATALGDAIELAAMIKAYRMKTQKKQFCAIGSVKPNVGHLDRASGVTGLIKTALALKHTILPPHLNFAQASADIDLDNSPFYVNTAATAWETDGTPRRAGVSSFGLGGTNVHLIMEEAPALEPATPSRPWQLLTLSAKTAIALEAATQNLVLHLQQHPEQALSDVAYTLQVGRSVFNHRRVVVCQDHQDACHVLQEASAAQRSTYQTYQERPVAFLFPGVGEQYAGMAQDLYEQEPHFRATIDYCCQQLQSHLGQDLRLLLFPNDGTKIPGKVDLRALLNRSSSPDAAIPERLADTVLAQPIVFIIEYALAQLLRTWGIEPKALIGYSLGEYTAACIAGVIELDAALWLVARRAQLIQQLPQGAMLAVPLSAAEVQPYLSSQINLAIVNSPRLCVLSGPVDAIAQLATQFQQQEIVTRRLETTHAFHSSMLAPLKAELTTLVQSISLHEPTVPYISNVTGTWITAEQATDPGYWAEHMCQTVRMAQGLNVLLEDSNTQYALLEVGPGQALTSMVKQQPACKHEQHALAIPTLPSIYEQQSAQAFLLGTLGKLWLAGVTINWKDFWQDERRTYVPLPTYPFERQSYWLESPHALTHKKQPQTQARGKKADVADWFYLPRWEKVPLAVKQSSPKTGQVCLYFTDEQGIGGRIIEKLRADGYHVISVQAGEHFARLNDTTFVVRPDQKADYLALCNDLHAADQLPKTIVHAWSLTAERGTGSAFFERCQQYSFYSLLFLVQALGTLPEAEPTQLVVLSNNVQAVTGAEPLFPEHAPLLGACKVIPQELLHLACRSIDLALSGPDGWDDAALIDALTAEICSHAGDPVVAYREQSRWVQSYVPQAFPTTPSTPTLRPQGVYLITGGLGGVGLVLAEHLAQRVQARLILLGRSSMPARDQWEQWLASHDATDAQSLKIQRIQHIESLGGEVLVLAGDVGNRQQMQGVIEQTLARFGALHGVIHAAGISDGKAFVAAQEIGPTECAWHFQPKVHGLYVLEEVLHDLPLDFCVLFSSLSSVLGGLWLFAYAAANRFLDAYAAQHNQQPNALPWLSVNWDSWDVREDAHGGLGATLAEYTMSPAEGANAFEYVLNAHGHAHIIESTGDLQARIRQWVQLESLLEDDEPGSVASQPQLIPRLETTSGAYERKIVAVWQQVLGINEVGLHDNFFDLGGNSLSGLQVLAKLRKEFHVQIPVVALFEAPTVSTLARYLLPSPSIAPSTQRAQLAQRRQQARRTGEQQAIAIIGMSGRFPGASTPEQFWSNQLEGRESVTFFTDEELLEAGTDPHALAQPNYVKARPILQDIDLFDATFFGYSPREAEITDPQHRLFLECAWEALEQAGYDPQRYDGLIGVFGGTNLSNYLDQLSQDPELLNSINDYQRVIGNDKDSLTTSVSYKMNLRGPSFAVQTFCSTSLVAVHLAAQSLYSGECDIALAGGVSIRVPLKAGHLYEEGGMESPDGHCRTFDALAKGSMFGDGVALVTLKRLEDALADGDTITAIIKGSAINNDGSLKVSYTAPSVSGQAEVVMAALANAGVEAESVNYIEAHGTATELGDPIEVASLTKAYRTQTQRVGYCSIGSVKTNVGHLDRAAGVTGLIRVVQALQHEQLPAILHYQAPNPEIDFAQSPFVVNTQLRPWKRNGVPRRAGINSLGMGGTNVHVIVQEAPEQEPSGPSRTQQVLLLSARTETALETMTQNLHMYLQEHPESTLADVAYTLQVGRKGFDYRRALVCESREDALSDLQTSNPRTLWTSYQTYRDRPVAFLYPGVGEQYAGMAQELYEQEEFFRDTVDYCCRVLHSKMGLDLRAALFPNEGTSLRSNGHSKQQGDMNLRALLKREDASSSTPDRLADTALAQPAVFVIEYALTQQLRQWGIEPKALIGYSLGEYVAACVAGVFSLDDALLLVTRRAQLIAALPPGAMLAVPLSEQDVQPYLNEQVNLALINGPRLCILAGPVAAIAQLEQHLSAQTILSRRLETTHAFHSKMLVALKEAVTELVQSITLHTPSIPYISNVTGTWITVEQALEPGYWAQHMCQTVRMAEGIECLLRDTAMEQLLLEIGPGQALTSMVKQHPSCDRDRLSLVLPTLPSVYERQSSQAFLLGTLGKLWLAGVTIDWIAFSQAERRQRLHLPTYPFERQRYWLEPRKGRTNKANTSLDDGLERKADIADWFYRPTWKQSAPMLPFATAIASENAHNWLLFIDDCGIGARLAEQLERNEQSVVIVTAGKSFARIGHNAYSVNPTVRSDYDALLKELRKRNQTFQQVVHLWSVTPDGREAGGDAFEQLTTTLANGFFSLMTLAQAINDQGIDCSITMISNNMQDVLGDEQLCPEKATLIGLCKVLPQEQSNINTRSIDIVLPTSGSAQEKVIVQQLLNELTAASNEDIIALRGQHRWVQLYEPIKLEEPVKQTPWLREGGVYMITGGLGGIAMAMAERMVRFAGVKLVLLSRSELPPRTEWERIQAILGEKDEGLGRKLRQLQALEAMGAEVLVLTADVTSEPQMQAAVQQTIERFGILHGVLHAAAIPPLGLIQLKTPEMATRIMGPKVLGTLILARVLKNIPLDFLVLFSSVSSATGGGPGQVDYCAANAFVNAYASRNFNQHGVTIAMAWGEWQWDAWHEGLQGFPDEIQTFFIERRQKYGIGFDEGFTAMERILARKIPQVFISTQDFPTMVEGSKNFSVSAIIKGFHELRTATDKPTYPRPVIGTTYVAPENEMEQTIAEIWGDLLGIGQIGIYDNFFELGGHSLMGTQLIARMRQAFQVNVTLSTLFDASTIAELAILIETALLEEIENLTEEEIKG